MTRRELLSASLIGMGALAGCRRERAGKADVPPGTRLIPGVYRDISPRWSPDGSAIAFLRHTTDRRYQLYTASPDLKSLTPHLEPMLINPDRPLRPGRAFYLGPEDVAWSPDGIRIAFPRVEWFRFEDGERLPGTGLWAYHLVEGRTERLALHPAEYKEDFYYFRSPRWSPNGARLAFMGEAPDGGTALHIRELRHPDTTFEKGRPDAYDDTDWPAWSPDGTRLLFRQGILRDETADGVETLRIISPGGMEARQVFKLTVSDYARLEPEAAADISVPMPRLASLVWSPDGRRVAFTITPSALDRSRYAIYVLEIASGGPPNRVSPRDGRGYLAPVWIGEERLGAVRPSGESFEAVELRLNNRTARPVARIPTDDLDWSPDRKRIVCARVEQLDGASPVVVIRTTV